MNKTVIRAVQPEALSRASEIAARLNLPLVPEITGDQRFVLEVSVEHLSIRDRQQPRTRPVGVLAANFRRSGRGRDLLARAIGRSSQTVVDATAGFGRDAFHIASLGRQVTAVERSPIVVELLLEAMTRFDSGLGAVRFLGGDSRLLLTELSRPDVVYLDPMFPGREMYTVAARKELELLRGLVGDDPDAEELWQVARDRACQRVVVKRPRYARPIGTRPEFAVKGRAVRYDVYLVAPP